MEVGDEITSSLYKSKGKGILISKLQMENLIYFQVFFIIDKDVITLEEKDIQKIATPLDKLKKGLFDNPNAVILKILSEKIDNLTFEDKLLSASSFKIMPLPHQILTLNQFLQLYKPRCLIADEVGLGKTIEAALIYEELKLRNLVKRILIIVPGGLTIQWRDELKVKFNEDFSLFDRKTVETLHSLHGKINVWTKYDRVITSLDFIKPKLIRDTQTKTIKHRRELHNQHITSACINADWDMVIFDEAHKLSKDSDGSETARYRIGKSLSEIVPNILLLTATPHQGNSDKFRHLLSLVDEIRFFPKESLTPENVKSVTIKNTKRALTDFEGNLLFKPRITNIIEIDRENEKIEIELYNTISSYVKEYYNLALRETNYAFMLLLILYQRMVSSSSRAIYDSLNRRLIKLRNISQEMKNNRKNELNDETYTNNNQDLYDELFFEDSNIIDSFEFELISIHSKIEDEIEILEECVLIARKASYGRQDKKIKKTIEIINEIIKRENNPETKFIIFTEFIASQTYIGEILKNLGFKVSYINGRMNLEQRISSKNAFKDKNQILVSTDAGGEGINLQFCHVIINYDLPWNPMKIEQRIGRIDRIGQNKEVLVFNLLLNDTIEERVRNILNTKLELIATQFGEDKKTDILNFFDGEFNFDKIYIEALKFNDKKIEELHEIGNMIYNQAKNILENQNILIPISEIGDLSELKKAFVASELGLCKKLIINYSEIHDICLSEYNNKKDLYYTDKKIDDKKLKNAVFRKDLSLENENYELVDFLHPTVQYIIEKEKTIDFISLNLEIQETGVKEKGSLFYFKLELTNNNNFTKKFLIPLFVDYNLKIIKNVNKVIANIDNYPIKMGIRKKIDNQYIEKAFKIAKSELNVILKKYYNETKLKLIDELKKEQTKLEEYYNSKKESINKIAIENIRLSKLEELKKLKNEDKIDFDKTKKLVPLVKLYAAGFVSFR